MLLLIYAGSSKAQIIEHYIGTPDHSEVALDVKGLEDGGSVMVGYVTTLNNGAYDYKNADMLVVRVDAAGNVMWNKRFGTPDVADQLVKVIVDQDGHLIVVGHMGLAPYFYTGNAVGRATIMRINVNDGSLIWSRQLQSLTDNHNSKGDVYEDVVQLDNGNICAVGVRDFQPDFGDAMITLYDINGNVMWHRVVTEGGSGGFYSVAQWKDRIYAAGIFQGHTLFDLHVAEFDATGSVVWSSRYDYAAFHANVGYNVGCNWVKEMHVMEDGLKITTTVSQDYFANSNLAGILSLDLNGGVMGLNMFNEPGIDNMNIGAVEYINSTDAYYTLNPAANGINAVYPSPWGSISNLAKPIFSNVDPTSSAVTGTRRFNIGGGQFLNGEDISNSKIHYSGLAVGNTNQVGLHDILYIKTDLGLPQQIDTRCPLQQPDLLHDAPGVIAEDFPIGLEDKFAVPDMPFEISEMPLVVKPVCECEPFTANSGALKAYYNFTAGSTADQSGNGHNGVVVGGATPTTDIYGKPTCAFSFPGLPNSYIRIPSHVDFNFGSAPATISVWYKPEETSPTKYELLVGRGLGYHCPNMSGDYSLALYDCRTPVGGINERSNWFTPSPSPGMCSEYYISQGWQHAVVVFDTPGGAGSLTTPVRVYWNNNLTTSAPGGSCTPPFVPTVNAGDIYIGADFKGSIDDVRIYDKALNSSEVADLYNYGVMPCCPPSPPNPPVAQKNRGTLNNRGIEEIKAYPNPVTDIIQVSIPEKFIGGNMVVYNSLGQIIFREQINKAQSEINMQHMPTGIYLIECVSGKERSKQKVTKL